MNPERWKRIEHLYHTALDRAPGERAAFLTEICANDSGLRRQVEELLHYDSEAGSFIEGNALAFEAQRLTPEELSQTGSQFLPGQDIGAYKILSLLAAGGMGVVYRARDERLRRDVAIKVLPASLVNDADRLRRFRQEAQATSALNHPNILTVYDIGTYNDLPYIVAELLEGEELRSLLRQGAQPLRKALDYAQQVARGLAAAHEKGIVHRDLKPENLFITSDGRVKILDFGLAKLKPQGDGLEDPDAATQKQFTLPGVVMGTVGYMAPEQVRGQETDTRADIFAFGVILYEMLSGQRAFHGASAIDVMSAILKEEPPELGETNAQVSPQLEKIVRRCLEKKPERRFQSAGDLGFALESLPAASGLQTPTKEIVNSTLVKRSRWRDRAGWIAAGAFALIALALAAAYFFRPSTNASTIRLSFTPPENIEFENGIFDSVVVSPDGQKLAFTGRSADGKRQIWVRSLGSTEAQLLPGTDDPVNPFWSPDSRSLGFGSGGKLKRIDLAGGRPQTLANATRFAGGSWSRAGMILYVPGDGSGVFQIPATGGPARQVTTVENAQERFHRNPDFLPDGRHFLFQEGAAVMVGSLDSGKVKRLLPEGAPACYATPGWLLFVSNGALRAQRFDAGQLELKGEAVAIANATALFRGLRRQPFAVSETGVLVWQGDQRRDSQLIWHTREGKQIDAIGSQLEGQAGETPRLSPDGRRVATASLTQGSLNQDIWVIDLARNLPIRLTFDSSREVTPIWSPDGSHLAYYSIQRRAIYQRPSNGVGEEELLLNVTSTATSDWSKDGRFIFYSRIDEQTGRDIWVIPLASRQPYPLFITEFDEYRAQLSPDGRYLAYVSNESGGFEVYVQPFTVDGKLGGDKKRISTHGGNQPRWRSDGSELFYLSADRQMMAVNVKTVGPTFEHGVPEALFKTRVVTDVPMVLGIQYDVTADGQRFLIGRTMGEPTPVSVILNWAAELQP